MPLPPASPVVTSCQASPWYWRLHGSQAAARRFPHGIQVVPSSSWAEA